MDEEVWVFENGMCNKIWLQTIKWMITNDTHSDTVYKAEDEKIHVDEKAASLKRGVEQWREAEHYEEQACIKGYI